jgi:hypothetical protein
MKAFIPKEIPGMPDAYGVEIGVFGQRTMKIEVVRHQIIDKVLDDFGKIVGVHQSPFWEFTLHENDELFCVPLAASTVKFDNRWYKICSLAKEFQEQERKVANE